MKFSAAALTFTMLFGAQARDSKMADIQSKRRMTKDFMDAMREPTIAAARQKGNAQKIRKLHENLMEASRKLTSYSGSSSSNYQNYQNNANEQQSNYAQYAEEDGSATGYYLDGVYYPWEEAPFDMTARAFKYSGCAAIKTYDEDRAYETGDPMVVDTYAVFRLCPADKCNDYSTTGCGKNYGEYALEMKSYLTYVLGYYDERFEEYCDYCEACDWEYQASAKSTLNQCYSSQAQAQYNAQNDGSSNANNNANGNYNANGNSASGSGYDAYQQYYTNGGSYNGGNRELENYYSNNGGTYSGSYNGNNYNNNNANNNNYNANQDADADADATQAYGYYDATGAWVDTAAGDNGQGYGYYAADGSWVDSAEGDNGQEGYWGADGKWYDCGDSGCYGAQELVACADGSMCDSCTWKNEQTYSYCDDYVCGDYYTYCSDLYGEQDEFDPLDYLECQGYKNQYGNQYYIGPHCGSDHYTISLGVFSDENCLKYIGDDISLATVLGFKYSDQDVFKLPKECISCDGAEEYAEENGNQNEGRYGAYVSSPATTAEGVVAMCSALYTGSAQCNMKMTNFESISKYMSQYELDQESRYCAFIENIVYGAYDESGEILLKPEQFDFADWQNASQYKKLKMPVSQALGLAASIILCVALLATAAVTNRALTRDSTPWKPSRQDVALARQNSGIVMGRSRSGPGAAPLI